MTKSVTFCNAGYKKQHFKELRRELLNLMGPNHDWMKSDNQGRIKRIQEIGEIIGSPMMGVSHPIKIKLATFSYREFKALRDIGYTVDEIKNAAGVKSSSTWLEWRISRGFKIDKARNGRVKRNERTANSFRRIYKDS
ncbi:hypothetical protein [uncultured Enterococcus sp.]|uniref:hypothetical protein n=1 Tax=uncultured Enterococcus sp. TaxID=167972 RepID=UPI002AA85B71|nr:hypothetical protein [uncultured Enterococcus sp.]